jgi:alkylation response protein AidB-like acyl-CoA dehydrogenase
MQILAGNGYTREFSAGGCTGMPRSSSRGTPEIQRLVIARAISGMLIR